MKILTICSSWRVFGAEAITLKMLEGFKRRGHEQLAVVSTFGDGEFSRRLAALGIREAAMPFAMVALPKTPKMIKYTLHTSIYLPMLWWRWRRTLRAFKPDVILWTGSKQLLLVLPWLDATPSFLVEFTHVPPARSMRWLYGRLSKKLAGFVAVSDFMRGHLHLLGAPADKIFVIKSGAFFETERPAIELSAITPFQNGKGPARIGIVGQVATNKGHDCLVEAVRLLKQQGTNVVVRTFGDGEPGYAAKLKEKIQNAGLAGIWEWVGYERKKEMIFGSIDICVVPSCFGDPFPTVAMEAGAYGLPVVASRAGGLPEIIEDGVTGNLVEPNSPEPLAEKIRYLINNPQVAREMGKAGRERVLGQFTVEKMVMDFEVLFHELVPSNGERSGQD